MNRLNRPSMNKSVIVPFYMLNIFCQDRHLFTCVDPLLLCLGMPDMGKVVLF